MSKRTIADLLNDGPSDISHSQASSDTSRPRTKPRLNRNSQDSSSPQLSFSCPSTSSSTEHTPFQKPTQIISFSYDSFHRLEFTNSALRYFVDPPENANLVHGYDRWIRQPEQKGRLDSLLRAFLKAKEGDSDYLADVGLISWRGVMTRYTFPLQRIIYTDVAFD